MRDTPSDKSQVIQPRTAERRQIRERKRNQEQPFQARQPEYWAVVPKLMRADVGVPNVALALKAGDARKLTIVVNVDELYRMWR